jgi:hypothetical protein
MDEERCNMPDRADVALAILTLVLAVVVGVGRLLLGVLACGERLLLAQQSRWVVIRALRREHVRMSGPSDPSHSEATTQPGQTTAVSKRSA